MKTKSLTIALSAAWRRYPERFEQLTGNGFAAEYSPNPDDWRMLPAQLETLAANNVPVRHHAFFPEHEFGHADADIAGQALELHFAALEVMRGWGEPVVTVHIGLDVSNSSKWQIDHDRAARNLKRLVEFARRRGITVCLENLRRGPTSNPETVLDWASRAGAMITLDIGHAVSCQRVQDGELAVTDIIDMFADRLHEVHMYERETDRHYPPADMSVLGPIVDRLLETDCRWWTIELDDLDEALATRRLLEDYLKAKNVHLPRF